MIIFDPLNNSYYNTSENIYGLWIYGVFIVGNITKLRTNLQEWLTTNTLYTLFFIGHG